MVDVLAMTSMIASSVATALVAETNILDPKNLLLVGGVMLLVAWSLMRLRSKRKHGRPMATPQELIERNRQARGMQGQLEELMIEVEALARRFGVQMDAKARRLENLLSQADERIEELRELQGQPPRETADPPGTSEPAVESADVTSTSEQPTPRSQAPAQPIVEDPLADSVYKLADTGMDAHAIAMQLNEHVGKVELILALRKVR